MSKICKACHAVIEDESKVFCPVCGAVVDANVKAALDLQKINQEYKDEKTHTRQHAEQKAPAHPVHAQDTDTSTKSMKKEEESHGGTIAAVVVIVVLVIAVAAYFFLR